MLKARLVSRYRCSSHFYAGQIPPGSDPSAHLQPRSPCAASCFSGNWWWVHGPDHPGDGAPGHLPPLQPIAFADGRMARAWPVPWVRGNSLSQGWWGQAHVSHCRAQAAEAEGRSHVPSSSTVSTAGHDRVKCVQNRQKGRKLRVCGFASYGALGSCFRQCLKCLKTALFCPAPKMEHQKQPPALLQLQLYPRCKSKPTISVSEASVCSSLMLGLLLRSWFSEAV